MSKKVSFHGGSLKKEFYPHNMPRGRNSTVYCPNESLLAYIGLHQRHGGPKMERRKQVTRDGFTCFLVWSFVTVFIYFAQTKDRLRRQ